MVKKVYSTAGKSVRSIDLSDEVFACKVSEGSIWHAIRNELANKRQGAAKVKTRAEVRGSTVKPWRQKGTGRARAGSRKSPLWRGGGVIHGPQWRDFSYKIPKKIKRLAMKSILALKVVDEECFRVVENFTIESGKTRDLTAVLSNFPSSGRTVLVLEENDAVLKRAGANIKNLSFLAYNQLRAHDLYYSKNVFILEGAAKKLGEFYGG